MIYGPDRLEPVPAAGDSSDDDEEAVRFVRGHRKITQIDGREVKEGSFDINTRTFSSNPKDYPLHVKRVPSRTRCLCSGGMGGSRSIITSVALGTSAAIKVLSEGSVESLADANADRPDHDGKQRLLIFSDSRQDASHRAGLRIG